MRKPWLAIMASEPGKRDRNEDAAVIRTWNIRRRRYYVMAMSDGVGSLPGSGDCANEVVSGAATSAELFVSERKTRRPLSSAEGSNFAFVLERHFAEHCRGAQNQAATLALALFGYRSALVAWAGDTRVYALHEDGSLRIITDDHHDAQGRIIRYVRGDGYTEGGIQERQYDMEGVIALLGTTDGVHESCSHGELRGFVLYCMFHQIVEPEILKRELHDFLFDNLSDNASMALIYQPYSAKRLATLSRMTKTF